MTIIYAHLINSPFHNLRSGRNRRGELERCWRIEFPFENISNDSTVCTDWILKSTHGFNTVSIRKKRGLKC